MRNEITRDDLPAIMRFVELLAEDAAQFAHMANVGGMETAGGVISYLAKHPTDLEPYVAGGLHELPTLPMMKGCLTWHAMNGKVVSPEYAERKRIAKMLGANE